MTNHAHGYRLRVGNYRVIFEFDGAIKLVRIEARIAVEQLDF